MLKRRRDAMSTIECSASPLADTPLGPAVGGKKPGLRALHFTTWKTACGIAGYAESLITALSGQGVINEVRPIDRVGMRNMACSEWRRDLAALCEQARQHDVVHLQHEYSFFTTLSSLRDSNVNFLTTLERLGRQGTPTVMTMHTEPSFLKMPVPVRQRVKLLLRGRRTWHGWEVGRMMRARPDLYRVIVHTRRSRAVFIDSGVPAEIIHVAPIGFDPSRVSQCQLAPAEAKRQLGLPADCVLLSLFGFVGRYKGHEVAVRALKELPANYYLAVVGGPHPEGNERTVNKILRLWRNQDPNRLRITGYVPQDQLDLYHAATDMCLAPYIDNKLSSSAAITWALTSGKPVVASSINAFREINETIPCMWMVTPKCEMELAWQIQRLAADPQQQKQLVENALRYAREHSWTEIAKRVVGIYGEIIRPKARRLAA
jgi:glycosyltransferase involved in cell wall biosynthesis